MTDLLFQYGLSNGAVSLVLASAAWAVHASGKRPAIAHLLWLVVLVKLVTPPIVSLPVVTLPQWANPAVATAPAAVSADPATPALSAAGPATTLSMSEARATDRRAWAADVLPHTAAAVTPAATPASHWTARWSILKQLLVFAWLLGTLCVLAYTLVRVVRFSRLLKRATRHAPAEVQRLAERVGRQLGLRQVPAVYTSAARLSPMVWWVGGPVRVVLPEAVADADDAGRLRWVLAHELAHVQRRDHLVRWVEWLACVTFWWNPVAWWARRNLRANEEVCCDALVLARFTNNTDTPTSYADAILSVVESLASPALRPPAIASEINSGGTLQRRFDMILSSKSITKAPRWASTLVLLGAVGLMPLGLAQASDAIPKPQDRAEHTDRAIQEKVEAAMAEIRAAVESGLITPEEGRRKAEEVRSWRVTLNGDEDRERGDRADAAPITDRDNSTRGHLRRMGMNEEGIDQIVAYLTEQGIGRQQMEGTLGGILRIAHGMHERGERYELGEDMMGYLTREVGLDEDEIHASLELAKKLADMLRERDNSAHDADIDIRGYFLRLGMEEAGFDRIVHTLAEHGVGRVQMEPTLGGLFHTVLAIRERGVEAAMETIDENEFFSAHVGLDEEQLALVAGLAQRIAARVEEGEGRDARRDGEQGEPRREGAQRDADRREREDRRESEREGRRENRRERELDRDRAEAERDAAMEAALVALKAAVEAGELTEAQAHERLATLHEHIAERVAHAERERENTQRRQAEFERAQPRARETEGHEAEKVDFEAMIDTLRAGVASGEITEPQANERLSRLREHMIHQVELALEADKITREEAREKVEAIRAMTQLGDDGGRVR